MAGRSEKTGGRTTIWLPPYVLEKLDQMAAARGASRSAVVREMVLKGIDRAALVEKIAEAVA